MSTLQYYFVKDKEIRLVVFNKYYIENGIIVNKFYGTPVSYSRNNKYNRCTVSDDEGKRYNINVGRAIASTLYGEPPSTSHTADHIDQNSFNDTSDNIRWLCKSGQNKNRMMPDTFKSAYIIVKDGCEKTIVDWLDYLKCQKNTYGRDYTANMIIKYAQKKKHGFSYKEYPDLPGEIWKEVVNSKNIKGHWEISNQNRIKYVTTFATNVFSVEKLGTLSGYPRITINKKVWLCHILSFMTFFPELYANMKPAEIICHEDDDRMDFRPHKLRIGTASENNAEAHNNGCYDGTKSARMKCASYIAGVLEREYESQHDAANYLKTIGYEKASYSEVGRSLKAFRNGKITTRYGRTWQNI